MLRTTSWLANFVGHNTQMVHLDHSELLWEGEWDRSPVSIGCFPIQTHAAAAIYPGYCTIRLFFGWLKTQPERKEYNEEDELYEVLDKILTALSIETVFVDWMIDSNA
jgi:hypothetical protein